MGITLQELIVVAKAFRVGRTVKCEESFSSCSFVSDSALEGAMQTGGTRAM